MNQHEAMKAAELFYYSFPMKAVLARLTPEWQTATQLSAKWITLNALVARGKAERRENPVFNTGFDAYQWRKAEKE